MPYPSTPMNPPVTPVETNRRYNTRSQKRKRSMVASYEYPAVKDDGQSASERSVNGLPTPGMGQILLEGRLPGSGNVNKKRAVEYWLSADAGSPIAIIEDFFRSPPPQGKCETIEVIGKTLRRDYFFEPQPKAESIEHMDEIEGKMCSRSPSPFCHILHMNQEPQTPYEAQGVYETPPWRQDDMEWQWAALPLEEKTYWRDKSIPEWVALPEVQPIPTAAEIRAPTPFPEPRMVFREINWNPPLRETRKKPADPVFDFSNRPISISTSSDASPRSPRRGPTTELKDAPYIPSRNQIEEVDPLDLNPPEIIPSVTKVIGQANKEPFSQPSNTPVHALFPGKGPFWENYKEEDYSGYIRLEYKSRSDLLVELKQKNKRIFELEIAASRDSWKIFNAEKEIAELDNMYVEASDNTTKLEKNIEIFKTLLSIAQSELMGMKEKRRSDMRRLNVAHRQLEKVLAGSGGFLPLGRRGSVLAEERRFLTRIATRRIRRDVGRG
ncbi:uncharacterized protein BDV14DRAFT_202261 [Aspergillus stella-maris]|uniref:uncharacterized protein n=1 Tax=Aspergillus stella-maris TaxID=1810926 RepID=UPI003CCDD724